MIWPPSQTYAMDAIRSQGSTPSTESKLRLKSETNDPIVVKGSKGKSMATAINIDVKRDAEGNVTESGKKEINRHLLKTLGQKHNPITNSDLYNRYASVDSLRPLVLIPFIGPRMLFPAQQATKWPNVPAPNSPSLRNPTFTLETPNSDNSSPLKPVKASVLRKGRRRLPRRVAVLEERLG